MSLLSTSEAAAAARVKRSLIRDWKRRGLLTPAGQDHRGWPLYDVIDVMATERRTHTDHAGHRRPTDPPKTKRRNAVRRHHVLTER